MSCLFDCVEAYDPVNPYNLIDNFVDKGNSLSIGILEGPSPYSLVGPYSKREVSLILLWRPQRDSPRN